MKRSEAIDHILYQDETIESEWGPSHPSDRDSTFSDYDRDTIDALRTLGAQDGEIAHAAMASRLEATPPVTFEDFLKAVEDAHRTYPTWRTGQAAFNVLHRIRPMLAESIRGNWSIDPFHRDHNLDVFYDFVHSNWERS